MRRSITQAGLSEGSPERAYDLWREVVGLILADKGVREAVAKGALPSASGDRTAATDRQMEVRLERVRLLLNVSFPGLLLRWWKYYCRCRFRFRC